jgi:hypothetical protein
MDEYLRKRLETMADPTDSGSWQDVLDRADRIHLGRGRRYEHRLLRSRLALATGAVLLLVLLVTPALAIRGGVFPFSSGEEAPQSIQSDFGSLEVGAPPGMAPGVSAAARRVASMRATDGEHSLWVAPTRNGGFCMQVDQLGGGCDRDRQLPISVEMGRQTRSTPVLVWGSVLGDTVSSVDLNYQDGQASTLPVTGVTEPINAGFFLFEVPTAHESAGSRPISLTARDANGNTLASENIPVDDVIFSGRVPSH